MALNLIVPQIISRKDGKSVIAKAAYNARARLRDERTGETKDYTKQSGLEWQGVFLDPNRKNPELSEWMKDRQQLYNAYEQKADRSTRPNDAQLAREFLITLPHELNAEQRRLLMTDFARELSRQGLIVDVSIHKPHDRGDERNYHAHMLLGMYRIDEKTGQLSAKKERDWNKKDWYQKVHARWSELGARYLEKAGFALEAERFRVGHLPREQQVELAEKRGDLSHASDLRNREAGEHLGPHIAAMEGKGIETELGNACREILQRNDDRATLQALKQELSALDRQDAMDKLKREFDDLEKAIVRTRHQPERERAIAATAKDQHRETEKEAAPKEQPSKTRFGDILMQRVVQAALRDPRRENDDPEQKAMAFRDALDNHHLGLARVTPEEAAKSYREAKFAKALERRAPVYQAGEIVLVREQPSEKTTSGRIHKLDQSNTEDFLRCSGSDKNQLMGVEATKQILDDQAQIRQRAIEAANLRKARGPRRGDFVAQQMWALRRVRDMENQRRREQEYRQRQDEDKRKRDGGDQLDAERYRTDPEYRRQVQQTQEWKSPEDKQRDRENAARAALEQQDRGR